MKPSGNRTFNAVLFLLAVLSPAAAAIVLSAASHHLPSYFPRLPQPLGLLFVAIMLAAPGAALLLALKIRLSLRLLFMSISVLIAIPLGLAVLIYFGCAFYNACP